MTHPLYESQLERKVLGEETLARKVHNDHIQHAVEFGIFGLFGWYWVVAAAVYGIFRCLYFLHRQDEIFYTLTHTQARSDVEEMAPAADRKRLLTPYARDFYYYLQLGILCGIIVAMVSCAFGHTFVLPASSVMFWLIAGRGLRYTEARAVMNGDSPSRLWHNAGKAYAGTAVHQSDSRPAALGDFLHSDSSPGRLEHLSVDR